MNAQDLIVDVSQAIEIDAALVGAYECLIRRMTIDNATPDNQRMPMVLELWPGGRWFRDLGEQRGHLWGFVQVIKPPTLIEIQGPMFMSYAAAGHVQFRLAELSSGVRLSLRHRVLGTIEDDHREGLNLGWAQMLDDVRKLAE